MKTRRLGGRRIFLIHGSNKVQRDNLKTALIGFGLEPVILSKEDIRGSRTIIEKFEEIAPTCNYAVALFTSDDVGRQNRARKKGEARGGDQKRVRQNVLIELGWFMAYLGRGSTFIVSVGNVEIPSDLTGIETHRVKGQVDPRCDKLRDFFQAISKSTF